MGDGLSQVSHTYSVCRASENGDDDDCVEERLASQDISVLHVRVTKNWAIVKKLPWFEIQLEEAFQVFRSSETFMGLFWLMLR